MALMHHIKKKEEKKKEKTKSCYLFIIIIKAMWHTIVDSYKQGEPNKGHMSANKGCESVKDKIR